LFVKKKKKLVHAVRASNQGPARAFGLRLGRLSIDWSVLGSILPVFWIATSQFNRARTPVHITPKQARTPIQQIFFAQEGSEKNETRRPAPSSWIWRHGARRQQAASSKQGIMHLQ
jgi:hypothetical protein